MNDKVNVYMPMYVRDYLVATAHLTCEERGAYSTLLFYMWERGGFLVLDHVELSRLCLVKPARWRGLWDVIKGFFIANEDVGTITNQRLQAELEKSRERKRRASDRGASGAKAKWLRYGASIEQASVKQTLSIGQAMLGDSSSTSTSTRDPPVVPKGDVGQPGEPEYPPDFERAWTAFPKVRGTRHDAFKAWIKLKPRPALARVLAGIEAWKASADWTKDGGKYTPSMAKWLNGRAWETLPDPAFAPGRTASMYPDLDP